jgi:hypothetical protein
MKLQLSFPGGEMLYADDNPIADCGNFDNG